MLDAECCLQSHWDFDRVSDIATVNLTRYLGSRDFLIIRLSLRGGPKKAAQRCRNIYGNTRTNVNKLLDCSGNL